MRVILTLLLCLYSPLGMAQSDESCKVYTSYREASGESLQGIKAVLQVISNRMRIDKMNACQVVSKAGQFPWMNSSVDWKVPKFWLTKYRQAVNLEPQVPDTVYYFSNKRFKKIGVFYAQIGNHFFYHKEDLV